MTVSEKFGTHKRVLLLLLAVTVILMVIELQSSAYHWRSFAIFVGIMAVVCLGGILLERQAAHPSSEDLACYIDGTLTPSEKAHIEGHLILCYDCRETVATVFNTPEENS